MQNFEELTNSIVKVRKVQGEEFFDILYTKAEIKEYMSKYSSSHKPTPKLYLDGKPITKEKGYLVTYRCSCGREIEMQLIRFIRKPTPIHCSHCRETEEKRKWQSECIRKNHQGIEYIHKRDGEKRLYDFDSESEDFKTQYFNSNLTFEEFEKVKPYLYQVKNVEIGDKNVVLLPHENGVNHKKYRQMLNIGGDIVPFKDIWLKCSNCGRVFSITRMIKGRVNSNNFECRGCYLNNTTFSVKRYREGLTYQSGEELNFIERCDKNNLVIQDGPDIPYFYEGRRHIYRIDFYLPEEKILVEVKDDHVWHRKQVENGKWEEKEKAAINFSQKNGLVYKILFPKDIDEFFKSYERDSQDCNESCRS
ncbi:MAG: hypothetical protein J6X18_16670 [Bacteroidales bacterium]|nr:hypothetical protein [Bacteroidales bacterium]